MIEKWTIFSAFGMRNVMCFAYVYIEHPRFVLLGNAMIRCVSPRVIPKELRALT